MLYINHIDKRKGCKTANDFNFEMSIEPEPAEEGLVPEPVVVVELLDG
jgi:hypothetical protein